MATKEATVFIIDIAKSMSEHHGGRDESDLQWAMQYVWDRITTTVATARKTAQAGVIALRSDGSNNDLRSEEGYQHISVLQPIDQLFMTNLRHLRGSIKPSSTESGDALSALAIAIQMISSHCKKLQYIRQIVLVTNGRGVMDADDLDDISSKLLQDSIQLVVVGVDFDDASYGYKEENKIDIKRENEIILKTLTERSGGVFGTMAQAIEELRMPRLKSTRPVASYKGALTLGDTENYDTALAINVERFPRTMVATAPSASNFAVKSDTAPGESSTQSSATVMNTNDAGHAQGADSFAAIKTSRTYQINDDSAPGGKRDVDREELAKGYTYGRKAVPISESEENVTKLESSKSLEIIGFIPAESHHRFTDMSRTSMIIPQKTDDKAYMALSSFVHALYETESFAVARLVTKDGSPPILLLLAPSIEPDYECLIDLEIPFAEDIRPYKFPPLNRIITVSGKVLTQHRNLPNEKLMKAMEAYVDQMDLSSFARDDEGNAVEYLPMDETYSPVLHRMHQAIRWRAARPMEEIPPPYPAITRPSRPPEELISAAKPFLDVVQAEGDVKKVPPKQLARKRARDTVKPLSGLDVDELLNREKRRRISPDNAVPEFKQMLATSEDPQVISDAAKQMSTLVQDWIKRSFGDSGYGRAIEGIRVMREELNEFEEPAMFNDVMRDLKKQLLAGELGGDRAEMWWLIRVNRLGLIDKRLNSASEVTEEEAKQFLAAK